ncbi:MAG: prolyl oligopeptidase family serine peptidase [Planctomycetaceae bacterium]|nr:prolyl oligopeptidase family serine peptidase [Planctomycetaceae bacterium]
MKILRWLIVLPLLCVVSGCPVTQPQPTSGKLLKLKVSTNKEDYELFLPSEYTPDKQWPLVITLHGTHGWDDYQPQMREWKYLGEKKGLIIAAPYLKSPQGILPVLHSIRDKQLQEDEKTILGIIDDVVANYHVDPKAVLLSGFSAGGYAMYYVGLRHPDRFNMLIARACNSSEPVFESIKLTDQARSLPIAIFWGGDDLKPIQDQSWAAFEYLRTHKCYNTRKMEIKGGHLRRPEVAYDLWLKHMPPQYAREPATEK